MEIRTMQADNDNLDNRVEGFDEWETLHEAARKAVESMAARHTLHQVGEEQVWETPLMSPTGGATGDHADACMSCVKLVSSR